MSYLYEKQQKNEKQAYETYLKTAGALSNLFSDSDTPYLYYRLAERVYCRAFNAEDLSRSDVSADARYGNIGIGLKTFLQGSGKSFQKVAEFNAQREEYVNLSDKELVKKIAELRNERIDFTNRAFGLEDSIYHCVVRAKGKFLIFEEPMHKVDIANIKNVKRNGKSSVHFTDGIHDYSFLLSKSTLTKRFLTNQTLHSIDVQILEDPLGELQKLFSKSHFDEKEEETEKVFLPLYGIKNKTKKVFEKSGLNQWNAGGRKRDLGEVYIPIPAKVHSLSPGFFPPRNETFTLRLPNGKTMQSKVCQDNSKALMSYSNRELGEWILREVLNLNEGEVLTYEKLEDLGIDSVRIDKVSADLFDINFAKLDSYEKWITSKEGKQ